VHYCVKGAFKLVHGFGFSGWIKMCVGEPHPSVGLMSVLGGTNFFCRVHFTMY
jgi:hypothetical protein